GDLARVVELHREVDLAHAALVEQSQHLVALEENVSSHAQRPASLRGEDTRRTTLGCERPRRQPRTEFPHAGTSNTSLALRGRLQASAQAEHLDLQDLGALRVAQEVPVDEQTLAAERDVVARQRERLLSSEPLGMILEHLPQQPRPRQ